MTFREKALPILQNNPGKTDSELALIYIRKYKPTIKEDSIRKNFSDLRRTEEPPIKDSFEQDEKFINIVCVSDRILSKEDVIKKYKIDLSVWELKSFKISTHEGYRKDKSTSWKVRNGKVLEGHVEDSGKLLVVPLYSVKVSFEYKQDEVNLRSVKDELIKEMQKFAPKYKTIKYNKIKDKFLLEPDLPDLHLGKLSWAEESGEDYDIKITEQLALEAVESLIKQSSVYSIERIVYPIGSDFFNVNSKLNTTVHGTPQQEDTRWQKTFVKGIDIYVKQIDRLSQIAPVDVINVPGNHDEERMFYLGEVLSAWFRNNSNVTVDNRAIKRKYYSYGKNLIGFTHGYYEKINELPLIMSLEVPELWANSKWREWQTGDKHHKKELFTALKEFEQKGVMVRILRSLTANDAWHFDKGYVGQIRGAEAFVRHYEKGLVAQFQSNI